METNNNTRMKQLSIKSKETFEKRQHRLQRMREYSRQRYAQMRDSILRNQSEQDQIWSALHSLNCSLVEANRTLIRTDRSLISTNLVLIFTNQSLVVGNESTINHHQVSLTATTTNSMDTSIDSTLVSTKSALSALNVFLLQSVFLLNSNSKNLHNDLSSTTTVQQQLLINANLVNINSTLVKINSVLISANQSLFSFKSALTMAEQVLNSINFRSALDSSTIDNLLSFTNNLLVSTKMALISTNNSLMEIINQLPLNPELSELGQINEKLITSESSVETIPINLLNDSTEFDNQTTIEPFVQVEIDTDSCCTDRLMDESNQPVMNLINDDDDDDEEFQQFLLQLEQSRKRKSTNQLTTTTL